MPTIGFVIPLHPVAQGRGKIAPGKKPHIYDPARSRVWKHDVRLYAIDAALPAFKENVPLVLTVVSYVKRPKAHYTKKGAPSKQWKPYPTGRPDASNYLKGIEDALNNILFQDDAQLVSVISHKRYADNFNPAVHISISDDIHNAYITPIKKTGGYLEY